jgi:hypothetical protein
MVELSKCWSTLRPFAGIAPVDTLVGVVHSLRGWDNARWRAQLGLPNPNSLGQNKGACLWSLTRWYVFPFGLWDCYTYLSG